MGNAFGEKRFDADGDSTSTNFMSEERLLRFQSDENNNVDTQYRMSMHDRGDDISRTGSSNSEKVPPNLLLHHQSSPGDVHSCGNSTTTSDRSKSNSCSSNNHNTSSEDEFSRALEKLQNTPKIFRWHDSPEGTGFNLLNAGMAFSATSMIYFSTALLDLAEEVAGCETYDEVNNESGDDDYECDGEVWGFLKPSSLVSTAGTFISLGSALVLPFIGAVIDHTDHRRQIGEYSMYGLIALNIIGIAICKSAFIPMVIVFVLIGFFSAVHMLVATAYLPDLNMDDTQMSKYSSFYNIIFFISMFVFQALVFAFDIGFDLNNVATCRVSQMLVTLSLVLFCVYPWRHLFTNRKRLHEVPQGRSLTTTGFQSIFVTMKDIHCNFPDLRTYIISATCYNSAVGALMAVSTTYMLDELGMSSLEITATFFVVFTCAVPGSVAAKYSIAKFGPMMSYRIGLAGWIGTTLLAVIFLRKSDDGSLYWISGFAVAWGFVYGFKDPVDTTIFTTIIPRGRETELMDINALSTGCLVWAPTLSFTILNEKGLSMHFCLASLAFYFKTAMVISLWMNKYEDVVQHARQYDVDHSLSYRRMPNNDDDVDNDGIAGSETLIFDGDDDVDGDDEDEEESVQPLLMSV